MEPPETADPGPPGDDIRERTRQTLAYTTRVFRALASSTRAAGDLSRAVRLERLANDVQRRLDEHAETTRRLAGTQQARTRPAARVLLVDDHELVREALHSVLTLEQGFDIVGEAVDGEQAILLAEELQPELVLMDVRLPVIDGLVATRAIVANRPNARVVIITSYDQRAILLEALRIGAAGFLLKGASKQEILAVLRAVLAGEYRVQDPGAADVPDDAVRDSPPGSLSSLSQRELEVVRLMARGNSNNQIADVLQVSLNTVKTHVRHILHKLDAADRAGAVARAAALGLFDSNVQNHPEG